MVSAANVTLDGMVTVVKVVQPSNICEVVVSTDSVVSAGNITLSTAVNIDAALIREFHSYSPFVTLP